MKTQRQENESKPGHDFEVKYIVLDKSQGGRDSLPVQGIKWDFAYENNNHNSTELFMIWPQFLDENEEVKSPSDGPISREGKARMWIVNSNMKKYHRDKIHIGMRANGMEGSTVVANYEVVKIVGLMANHIDYNNSIE